MGAKLVHKFLCADAMFLLATSPEQLHGWLMAHLSPLSTLCKVGFMDMNVWLKMSEIVVFHGPDVQTSDHFQPHIFIHPSC